MSFIEGGKTMAKINEPDYDLLRASVKNIIIEDNPAGKGFIINLLLKDGAQKAYPEVFQLAEVLALTSELGRLLHLPESAILIKTDSIDENI
jgi:hypothetical protein